MTSIPKTLRKAALLILLLCSFMTFAQTPGKFKFNNKEYYIYPYRVNKGTGIPSMGYKLPDGEYVVFCNYTFKKKFSFKKQKKYVLKDTSLVSAVVNIKNNTVNGPAVFYERNTENYYRDQQNQTKVIRTLSGNFKDGLKEGVWKSESAYNKGYYLSTYKNGIEEGYHYVYTENGTLDEVSKYCNGERCDTVTEYTSKGKIFKQYDICPRNEQKKEFSVYNKAIDFISAINIPKAKTFFKSDSYKIDLKFDHGEVMPFDSIGVIDSTFYKNVRYVSIHTIGKDQLLLTTYQDSKYEKLIQQYYYQGDYLYRETKSKTSKVYKKKKRFSKTRVLDKEETVYTEENYTDPKTVDMNSTVPVMVSKEYRETDSIKSWYIPKYQFAYTGYSTTSFRSVDTTRHWIYLNKKHPFYLKKYKKDNLNLYFSNKEKLLHDERFSPYKEKKYIVGTAPDNLPRSVSYHSQSISRNFPTENFSEVTLLTTYSKNDTLLNGQYYFGDSRKETKDKIAGYIYVPDNSYNNKIGNMANGLKEGPWKELYHESRPKYLPTDLKTYFFDNAKAVRSYNEFNYKNGMLNGKCVYYKKTSVYPTPKSKHTVPKLYKDSEAEFTNDTLNGSYKSYFSDGNIQEEGTYVMGLPDGDYKEYNSPGELSLFMQFDKGKLNGRYVKYRNKKLSCTANFENNRLKDTLIYFYLNRKPMLIIHGRNDTLTKRLSYFNSGQLKEQITFDDNSGYKLSKESISSESFIEILNGYTNNDLRNASGQFKNYYDNGQVLSEGAIKNGKLSGPWTFYSINGVAIHKVNFADTSVMLPGGTNEVDIDGFYTGYYVSGKKRCEGYIKDLELSFDCFTKQDKANLDFYITEFYDIDGVQTVTNGTGQFIKFDPNGSRMASGRLVNCIEDSLWRYYTPDQKLTEIGHYVNSKKDGVWYSGDLEGINFEDGACFDMEDPDAKKAYFEKQKELKITQSIYKNGSRIKTITFESNLNKDYKARRRGRSHVSF